MQVGLGHGFRLLLRSIVLPPGSACTAAPRPAAPQRAVAGEEAQVVSRAVRHPERVQDLGDLAPMVDLVDEEEVEGLGRLRHPLQGAAGVPVLKGFPVPRLRELLEPGLDPPVHRLAMGAEGSEVRVQVPAPGQVRRVEAGIVQRRRAGGEGAVAAQPVDVAEQRVVQDAVERGEPGADVAPPGLVGQPGGRLEDLAVRPRVVAGQPQTMLPGRVAHGGSMPLRRGGIQPRRRAALRPRHAAPFSPFRARRSARKAGKIERPFYWSGRLNS